MKRPLCLDTKFVPGAFLLAGLLALTQTTPAANNRQPHSAASGPSFGRQTQSGRASGTTMPGIAVDHTGDGGGVQREDTGKSGDNPLFEGKGQANLKSGADAAPPQSTSRKHIAGVKYEDRVAGNTPGGTAGHATHDVVQSKANAVIGMNETADRNSAHATGTVDGKSLGSAHATESLRTSSNAKAGDNPLYQDSGKSGTNPIYEPGKMQKAGTTGNPRPSAPVQRPK